MIDFVISNAAIDDAGDIARIHVAGWQAAYGGIIDQAYLDSLSVEQRAQSWRYWIEEDKTITLLARDGNRDPAGFCSCGKLKTPPPGSSPIRPLYSSEIYAIYILPEYWRQGLGTLLVKAAAQKLREMKHKSLCLWVLEKNRRGTSFYKKLGGERCGKKEVTFGPTTAREVCYGWRDTAPLLQ